MLVMTGGPLGSEMVTETARGRLEPTTFDAVTENAKVPVAAGIPLSAPDEALRLNPPGRAPLEVQVSGVEPVAENWWAYATPVLPAGGVLVLMVGAVEAPQFDVLIAIVPAPSVTVAPGQFAPLTEIVVCACTCATANVAISSVASTVRSFEKLILVLW